MALDNRKKKKKRSWWIPGARSMVRNWNTARGWTSWIRRPWSWVRRPIGRRQWRQPILQDRQGHPAGPAGSVVVAWAWRSGCRGRCAPAPRRAVPARRTTPASTGSWWSCKDRFQSQGSITFPLNSFKDRIEESVQGSIHYVNPASLITKSIIYIIINSLN